MIDELMVRATMCYHLLREIVSKKRLGRVTINYVFGLVFGAYLAAYTLPEVITAIQAVNTSAWTFTGNAGAAAIWGLTGFMIVVGFGRRLME